MLVTFSYVTFWLAVVVQIVNGWILVTVGDQFIYLKGLRKLDVSESLLQEIKHTSLVALVSYLFLWSVYIWSYIYNTPFLDVSDRTIFLQSNSTLLILFFILTAFEYRNSKEIIDINLFKPKEFKQKLLRYNLISLSLTLGAYIIISIIQWANGSPCSNICHSFEH